jgi:hypothetical protein
MDAEKADARTEGMLARRRLHYSLRGMLVLTAVVALVLGWQGPRFKSAILQRRAIAHFRGLDGIVVYTYVKGDIDCTFRSKDPFVSSWICQLLGEDYFFGVAHVTVINHRLDDSDIPYLKDLRGLESVLLDGDGLTDACLTHLSAIPTLRVLFLSSDKVTEDAMGHLGKTLPRCDVSLSRRGRTKTWNVDGDSTEIREF